MPAFFKKPIILLFTHFFIFNCFSMETHNNDFEEHLDPQYPNHTTVEKGKEKINEESHQQNDLKLPPQSSNTSEKALDLPEQGSSTGKHWSKDNSIYKLTSALDKFRDFEKLT